MKFIFLGSGNFITAKDIYFKSSHQCVQLEFFLGILGSKLSSETSKSCIIFSHIEAQFAESKESPAEHLLAVDF